MSELTIVMYHYIRELGRSRFPGLKALELSAFRNQLGSLRQSHRFASVEEIGHALRSGEPLPENSVLLSFDDGYAEHFSQVFPILDDLGVQGAFFPPAQPVLQGRVLDVNKLQFVLASVPIEQVLKLIFQSLGDLRNEGHTIASDEQLIENVLNEPDIYDTREVVFVKRLLQRDLPENLRGRIIDRMFREFITADEAAFSAELYATVDQLKCMVRRGQYVGHHGWSHCWMGCVPEAVQVREIDAGLEFLKIIGAPTVNWAICYPYGSYDESLLNVVRQRQGLIGLTMRAGTARLTPTNALTLERIDTIHLATKAPVFAEN